MSCNTFNRRSGIGPITAASLLVLTAISLFATPAKAVITDTDWSLKISEREKAFRPASDAMAMKTLMWDLPASRRTARNLPTICLTNESATAIDLAVQDDDWREQFHFGELFDGHVCQAGQGYAGLQFVGATEKNGGNTLVVNFLNGGIGPRSNCQFPVRYRRRCWPMPTASQIPTIAPCCST